MQGACGDAVKPMVYLFARSERRVTFFRHGGDGPGLWITPLPRRPCFQMNAPKPRNSTRSRLAKAVAISSKIDPIRNRGEHMRILLCDALNQF